MKISFIVFRCVCYAVGVGVAFVNDNIGERIRRIVNRQKTRRLINVRGVKESVCAVVFLLVYTKELNEQNNILDKDLFRILYKSS